MLVFLFSVSLKDSNVNSNPTFIWIVSCFKSYNFDTQKDLKYILIFCLYEECYYQLIINI